MIDAELTAVSKARLQNLYRTELRKAVIIEARLAGARHVTSAWGCDATLYRSTRAAESNTLLVGDAASFIEPLSSAGVSFAKTVSGLFVVRSGERRTLTAGGSRSRSPRV